MNPKALKVIEALKKKPDLYNEVREYLADHPLSLLSMDEPDSCYMIESFFGRNWHFFAGLKLADVEAKVWEHAKECGCDEPLVINSPCVVPVPEEFRDTMGQGVVMYGLGGWTYERGPKVTDTTLSTNPNLPTAAWVLQHNEHEFGMRGMGWSLWENEEDAKAHAKKHEGPGAPDQYFSYDRPVLTPITPEVAALLMANNEPRRITGKGNNAPSKNTKLTREHFP